MTIKSAHQPAIQQPEANPSDAANEWVELENAVNRAAALICLLTEKLSFYFETSEPEGEASGAIQFGILDLSRQAVAGLIEANLAAWQSHCALKNAAREADLELP
jgi:hypothetical protein